MIAFAWLRCPCRPFSPPHPCRPFSPPEPCTAAGNGSPGASGLASPDGPGLSATGDGGLDPSAAHTGASVRHAAFRLRRGLHAVLASALLSLPLMPAGAHAQAVECTTANTDGSYTVPADWALKPSALTAGQNFRLLFITSTTSTAQSSAIATYNTIVQTRAKDGHSGISDSCGDLFAAVGSTSSVDARENTDTEAADTDAAIYWLDDEKVADDYADFYDGSWDGDNTGTDEDGTDVAWNVTYWTGSDDNGTGRASRQLGNANAHRARVAQQLSGSDFASSQGQRLLAMSPVFKVATLSEVSVALPMVEGVTRRNGAQVRNESEAGVGVGFDLSASPAPAAGLNVCVRVTEAGDGDRLAASAEGLRQVTVPTTGSAVFTVDWAQDTDDEPDTTVLVEAVAPGTTGCPSTVGAYTVSSTEASDTALIVDDDPTTVTLSGSAGDVTEGGTRTFDVTLGRGLRSGEAVEVPLAFGGEATRGTDYTTACPGTLPAGVTCDELNAVTMGSNPRVTFTGPSTGTSATSVTLTLSATADSAVESAGETVEIGLGTLVPTGLGGGASGTDSLADFDIVDVPSVSLSVSGGGSASEASGARTLTVTATRSAANTSGSALSIPIRVKAAGTTAQPADYTLAGSISIANNATAGTATFTVTDDSADERDETVVVELGALPSGTVAGTPSEVTVTIRDDDATVASLVATADTTFTEQDATDTAAVTVSLSRRLRAGEQLAVPLDYVTSPGVKEPGESDPSFALSVSGTGATGASLTASPFYVRFTGHDTDIVQEATVTVTPTSNGDADVEDGSLEIEIPDALSGDWTNAFTNVGGGGDHDDTDNTVRLTYADDDEPVVSISSGGSTVTEGTGSAFTVTASPVPAEDLTVDLRVDDAPNADFVAAANDGAQTVTVPSGLSTATFNLATMADAADEPSGAVTVTVRDGDGYGVDASASSGTVTVNDDDATVASLVATADTTFTEEDTSDTAAVTVRLSRRLYAGEQLDVPIEYGGESGVVAHDQSNPSYTVSVSGTGATGADLTSDIFYVEFTGHDTNVVQEATVTLTPTSNGDADRDDGSLTLEIPAAGSDWIRIPTFTNVGGGGDRHGTDNQVRLTYRDDEAPPAVIPSNCVTGPWYDRNGRNPITKGCIWLSAPSGAVAEGTAVPFTIHAHPPPTEDIEVDLVVFDALFRSDADGYFPDYVRGRDEGRKRLVIGTGMSSVTHMVPTVDDAVYDAPGSVRAKIWGGGETVRKNRPSHEISAYFNRGREQSVEVTNDDSKASAYVSPEVYVSAEHRYQYLNKIPGRTVFTPGTVVSAGTAVTRGERAEFCVGVEGGLLDRRLIVSVEAVSRASSTDPWIRLPNGKIGVQLSYSTPGDRRPAEGCVKVDTAGLGGREVAVRAVQAGRVYNLGQNRLNLPYTVGANAIATRQVRAAQAGVSFTTGPRFVREEAGTVDVHVDIVPPPSSELTLGFAVAGTATPGTDYTIPGLSGQSGTLTVPAGAGRATIPVTIVDDTVEDSAETVVLTLRASGGYGVAAPGSVTLTILNHDPPADGQVITADTPSACTSRQAVADYLIEVRDNPPNTAVRGNPVHIAKWNRVLEAIGHDTGTGLSPMPASEIHANAAQWPDSPFKAASDHLDCVEAQQDQPQQQEPEIAVSAGSAVTEGGDAMFTLTATPAPAADLSVSVSVTAAGDYGIAAGTQTVTIPTSGSATLTLATAGDDADEPDGSVTVTVADGSGYTVGSSASGTVSVRDDDDAAPPVAAVDPALVAEVRAMAAQTQHGAAHVKRWRRVLVAFGVEEYPGLTPTTLAEAEANAQKYSSPLWPRIAEALEKLEAAAQQDQDQQQEPEIAVSAGSAVTEGGDAVFTLTATPAPAADLPVSVTVAADGDWGVTAGSRTVTIPASGSVTLTLATTDDAADEPDGSVTVTVADGSGYTVGSAGSGTVAVRDDDAPLPVVTLAAGNAVTEGGDAVFTLTASPAPAADLPVSVSVAADGDYGISAGTQTVTIPTTGSATLTLATTDDGADEPDGSVTATVQAGSGYTVGSAGSGTVAVSDDDLPPPVVTIAAKAASVAEGGDAEFTLTADRAPDSDITVTLAVSETGDGDHVAAADEGPATLAIPKGATEAVFTLATVNDDVDEPDGAVTVAVTACAGCTVGDPASASVEVTDDDAAALPVLSVGDATLTEGVEWLMPFTVRLSAAAPETVTVRVDTRDSTPVSATRRDYWPVKGRTVTFRPGETERTVTVLVYDDYHDEGPETFEVVLSDARGAAIGDGVAVGTIVNDDPLPGAWLARFGRTVAEQALDGIAARMAAPRTAGMQGSIAGQALAFGGGAADGVDLSRSPGPVSPGSLSGAGFGQEAQARGMTMREVLQGSSFSLTGEADSSGGTLAFWGGTPGSGGLVSGSRFAGDRLGNGTAVSLHGETATALLGTDYARGRWLVGFALSETRAEGGYAGEGGSGGPDCSGLPAEACALAARAGDGEVEASLTATIPYAALDVTERLRLWGAAGHGAGDVTVRPAQGGSLSADTAWSMAAAGLRGDLLAPAAGSGTGPSLSLTSDALWVRTSSEKTRGLAASESDVTRLRVGLEGSWGVALPGGGAVTPTLELGARHDGGDAETGFGVELGGGLAWTDPGVGLSLDLSGRTLVAHDDGGLEDRGVSAQLSFDPSPASGRGLSLGLGQDWGGRSQGGLDALFQPEPLEDRGEGNSEAVSRWSMEAAYGLPAFGGRFTGSPYMGFGLATGARDYTLGWRLAPEAAGAPDLSFGLHATRRESDAAAPEHTVGVEMRVTW